MLFFIVAGTSYAKSPIKATLSPVSYTDGEALTALEFKIPSGWKVYTNEPGDSGLPIQIIFESKKNLQNYSIDWPAYYTESSEVGSQKFITNVYMGDTLIPIHLYPVNDQLPISIKGKITFGACEKICIKDEMEFDLTINKFFLNSKLNSQIHNVEIQSVHLLTIILFAFIGGFILNFMPCVLPVLALKLLGVIKYSGNSQEKSSDNLLATASGIIASFILLATITIFLRSLGIEFGWGFQFQEPWFLVFLIVILIIFAGNLWGDYEINLPQGLNNYLHKSISNRDDLKNSFVAGAFATLLATPCTAPFLSVSVAFALTQGWLMILMIYMFLGLGMSCPYIILAFKPQYLRFIPKPGEWMVYLKKFFGILLVGTAVWLLYILSFQISIRALSLLIGFLIIFKFTLNKSSSITNVYLRTLTIIGIIVLSLITPIIINEQDSRVDKNWQEFSLAKVKNQNQVVLVDVTAEWCIICKTNKLLVLDQDDIIEFLKANNVLLLRADFTNRSPEITSYLESKGRYGIPLNVVYGPNAPDGLVLPELMSKNDLRQAVLDASKH